MEERDWYSDISNIASFQETTGLMPYLPQDEEEYESLQTLSGMQIPRHHYYSGAKVIK